MTKVTRGYTNAPRAAQLFGNAGREYIEKYEPHADLNDVNVLIIC